MSQAKLHKIFVQNKEPGTLLIFGREGLKQKFEQNDALCVLSPFQSANSSCPESFSKSSVLKNSSLLIHYTYIQLHTIILVLRLQTEKFQPANTLHIYAYTYTRNALHIQLYICGSETTSIVFFTFHFRSEISSSKILTAKRLNF